MFNPNKSRGGKRSLQEGKGLRLFRRYLTKKRQVNCGRDVTYIGKRYRSNVIPVKYIRGGLVLNDVMFDPK